MFSGLITAKGQIQSLVKQRLLIQCKGFKVKQGDSVAINGVCLTVIEIKPKSNHVVLAFDLSDETLKKTTLKNLQGGTTVNLEPALRVSDALGGHIVQGHVDGVGRVVKIDSRKDMKNITFQAPASIMKTIVPKGSITVDGVSLTAVNVKNNLFSVALIPFTLQHTNLMLLKKGNLVNLEADIIGKYVQKYLEKK